MRLAGAGALAAVLVTAGCSSSGTDSGGSTSSSSSLQTVSVGTTSLNALHLWMIVAIDQKVMQQYGIDFKFVGFSTTGDAVAALTSGSLDFAASTPESIFPAQAKAPNLQMVAAEGINSPYDVIANKKISSLSQLSGQTIGVTDAGQSSDWVTSSIIMAAKGIKNVKYFNAGAASVRVSAMAAGEVQAVLDNPPDTYTLTAAGNHIIGEAANFPQLQNYNISTLISDKDWYSKNRTLAVKFMKGYQASIKYLYNPANKATVISDMATTMKISQSYATQTYNRIVVQLKVQSPTGLQTLAQLTKNITNDTAAGLTGLPSVSSLPSRFDTSLIKAATG
jgi:ABC-type nitrate/sulfonate/bicarbonate transport system substrate-binding protein